MILEGKKGDNIAGTEAGEVRGPEETSSGPAAVSVWVLIPRQQ